MSFRSLVCLSALCVAALGCPDDEEQAGGDVPPGQVDPDGPSTPQPDDPSGPGVEPPDTMMPGPSTTAGTAAAPPTGAPNNPTNSGGQAGSGDMSGEPPAVVADAGTAADECATLAACALEMPCVDSELHCIALPSCGGARCVDPILGCELECGPGAECDLLESYPEQLGCGD